MGGINSPLRGWMGGKFRLASRIIERIPEHLCFCEPFAGAAWVLFRKEPSQVEVLNDVNLDLVTLYRVVQNHLEEFVRYFKWMLVSRDEFQRLKRVRPDTLTDIQRAARFFYVQRSCFGGRINSPAFGTTTTRPPKLNLLRVEEELSAAHLRLAQVYLESLPYAQVIERYDRPHTFFFLDPPYWGCENDYGKDVFGREDFAHLADLLARVQGKFLLTLNDRPEVRELFGKFRMESVSLKYSVGRDAPTQAHELMIRNY